MVNGVASLSNTIQTKLKSVNIEDGLTAETAKQAGLTQDEINEIKSAGVNVADDAVGIDAKNIELTETDEKTAENKNKSKMHKFKNAIKTFFTDLGNAVTERLK